MTTACTVCGESEGHAADCPYPDSIEARFIAFDQALRALGRQLWAEFLRVLDAVTPTR